MDKIKVKSPIVFFSFVLALLTLGVVAIIQNKLPPEVPLLYGSAEGEGQLMSSWGLVTPSLVSIGITVINYFISRKIKDDFTKKILVFSALVVTLFSSVTTFKIIFLVGSF